jgi:hypothetical protein
VLEKPYLWAVLPSDCRARGLACRVGRDLSNSVTFGIVRSSHARRQRVLPDLPSQPDRILHRPEMSWEEVGVRLPTLTAGTNVAMGGICEYPPTSARSTEWAGLYNTSITARTAVADCFLEFAHFGFNVLMKWYTQVTCSKPHQKVKYFIRVGRA